MIKRVALLATAWLLSGCASTPSLDVGSAWGVTGQTGPTLVMQAGFGEGRAVWQPLIADLARDHRVFAHDRPGVAGQPSNDAPRDPCSIADEQRALLRAAGLSPPYLLLGHSLGGLYQYVYAKRFPEDVAGLVLLDPTHPRNWETLKRTQPGTALLIQSMQVVAMNRAQQREFAQQTECLDRLEMTQPLSLPSALLISGRPDAMASPEYEKARLELAQDWLRLSGLTQFERVWEAGHHIQTDSPASVAAAVRRISGSHIAADAAPSEQTLQFGKRPALRLQAGVTPLKSVTQAWGKADETRRDGDLHILVYRDAPLDVPLAVSWIPVIGDIADAVATADALRRHQEAILRFDAQGRVSRWSLRTLR